MILDLLGGCALIQMDKKVSLVIGKWSKKFLRYGDDLYIPTAKIKIGEEGITVRQLIVDIEMEKSKTAAKKLIEGGGFYIEDYRVKDPYAVLIKDAKGNLFLIEEINE